MKDSGYTFGGIRIMEDDRLKVGEVLLIPRRLLREGISARLGVLGKAIETGNLDDERYAAMVSELSKEDLNRG